MFEHRKKEFFWQVAFTAFIFSVIAGAASGLIAAVLANQSLDHYYQTLLEEQEFAAISQVRPEAIPGTYEEALSVVHTNLSKTIGFVHAKSTDASTVSGLQIADGYTGACAIITNDGWMACYEDVFENFYTPISQAEMWIEGSRYAITSMVADSLSDLVMVKIEATNLSSVAFGDAAGTNEGTMLFAATQPEEIFVTSFSGNPMIASKVALPDVQFVNGWSLSTGLPASAPLFNSSGKLVALGSGSEAISLTVAWSAIESTIAKGEISHASMGVTVISIPDMLNASATAFPEQGALITAIAVDSPAELSGFLVGDVILSIGGTSIEKTNLAEVLAGYEVGDVANVEFSREGEIQKVDVAFGSSEMIF
ncbi:MAG: PDZ domain-containing protein [Patescibacteria group bacterium]|jgi:hypothetical protein